MDFFTTHKIINGDSRQMSSVENKSVNLVITSPPYWQLKDYGLKVFVHKAINKIKK